MAIEQKNTIEKIQLVKQHQQQSNILQRMK